MILIPEVLAEETEQEMDWKGVEGRRRWLPRMRRVLMMVALVLCQLEVCLMLSWNLEMELLWQQKWVVLLDLLQVLG